MRPEYDFSGGVRGKYAKTLRENGYVIRARHADGRMQTASRDLPVGVAANRRSTSAAHSLILRETDRFLLQLEATLQHVSDERLHVGQREATGKAGEVVHVGGGEGARPHCM